MLLRVLTEMLSEQPVMNFLRSMLLTSMIRRPLDKMPSDTETHILSTVKFMQHNEPCRDSPQYAGYQVADNDPVRP